MAPAVPVLVYEPGRSNLDKASRLVEALGYHVVAASDADQAVALVSGEAPPDVALVGLPGGEAVARAVAAARRDRPALVLTLSDRAGDPEKKCLDLGADTFTRRPLDRAALEGVLRAARVIHAERRRADALSAEVNPDTGLPHLPFFKKLLEMELKRARRYGYSLAACLVELDRHRLPDVSEEAARSLKSVVARRLKEIVRDIDLPVDVGDGRILVLLPYTEIEGAERVGERLARAVSDGAGVRTPDGRLHPSVSIGIAALRAGREPSVARLVRDANQALRAARLKGGGQVVVRR